MRGTVPGDGWELFALESARDLDGCLGEGTLVSSSEGTAVTFVALINVDRDCCFWMLGDAGAFCSASPVCS